MGLGDIEPLLLPHLDGVYKSSFGARNLVELAHHGAAALGMLAFDHLRLHIKDLAPQAEVWGDVEEGLTHDDERRDVEEGIRGQIVEILPVIVHKTSDKGVQGKSEPSEEVGDKNHPFSGLWVGMICPGVGSLCFISAVRYLASRRSWMLFSVTAEAIHLP